MAGIAGALVAVPLAAAVNAVVQHLAQRPPDEPDPEDVPPLADDPGESEDLDDDEREEEDESDPATH